MNETIEQCQRIRKYMMIPDEDKDRYNWIWKLRLSIIIFSAIFLIINIAIIIKNKQYKFNTIKLFMFVEIFYVLSLLSVTLHQPDFNMDYCEFVSSNEGLYSRGDFFDCIVIKGQAYRTAMEGYVNMVCYTLSYWFAVCITLYIKHVLQNNHRQFMKKRGPLIFAVSAAIALWFLVPFVLAFFKDVSFSFGPTGYRLLSKGEYLLYGGVISRSDGGQAWVIVWMLGLPLIFFAYHIYLLYKNHNYIKRLVQLEQINPRQFFIIKSGRLSFLIFFVQIFNVSKFVLSFIVEGLVEVNGDQETQYPALQIILFIVNVIFDLMPLVLISIYFRYYYRQGRDLQERSELMEGSLASSLHSGSIL